MHFTSIINFFGVKVTNKIRKLTVVMGDFLFVNTIVN